MDQHCVRIGWNFFIFLIYLTAYSTAVAVNATEFTEMFVFFAISILTEAPLCQKIKRKFLFSNGTITIIPE